DYVSTPDAASLDLASGVTLEAWIYLSDVTGYGMIVDKTTSGQPSNYFFGTVNDELTFGFYNGAWREHTTSAVNLVAAAWVHVAAVYSDSANSVRLYVDGVERLAATQTNSLATNTNQLRIGIGYPNEVFSGRIDEVRVYNRALTAAEISADGGRPVP
ncbi:MAG: LamG domain-containing protein, partial [Candidatus Rokuibacteriota bacterium]